MECTVADCNSTASAHGLCPKHYMRQRRHGDVETKHRAGRKSMLSDEIVKFVRSNFSELSPRTRARFMRVLRCHEFLRQVGLEDFFAQANNTASRPNGSLNISLLLDPMEARVRKVIAEAEAAHQTAHPKRRSRKKPFKAPRRRRLT